MAGMDTQERRRRRRERITVVILAVLLGVFTGIEVHLLRLSATLPFVNSIFFFGLMNLNIVLIMLLLFLVFRNAVKLILDERRGRAGSRLRTRLVCSFILFAIIPTVLLFGISAFYIKNSFDKWFSIKIGGTLQRSIEVVKNYYENTERSARHFARKIGFALEAVHRNPEALSRRLSELRMEYGPDGVEYYSDPFSARIMAVHPGRGEMIPPASLETLNRVFAGTNECKVQNVGAGEVVRCGAYLGPGRGAVFVDYFIPVALASGLSEINLTYQDFKRDNPLNYPIKSTYFAILSMVTLLILFTASWTGFYVAKRLTGPIDELLKGTEQVARGNLDHRIPTSGGDEMLRLIESFNRMTHDLRQNKDHIEASHENLRRMNEELSRRGRYIEILLENVRSGVVSLNEAGRVTTVNQAAAQLLGIPPPSAIGKPYSEILPEGWKEEFGELMVAVQGTSKPVRQELRVRSPGGEWITLLVHLGLLRDPGGRPIGVVAIFDDVTGIQKMERMFAWREVAKRIAHEIKNPLTPIQLSVQRLRRRYLDRIADDGTFDEATSIILSEVDSLKRLVGEFTSFARLPEIRQEPADLNQIVMEASNLFRAAHESLIFDLRLQESLGEMQLDRDQLKRALVNLFDNALSAMNGRGTITVTTEHEPGAAIRLAILDEGCGIRDVDPAQLFEPYFSTKAGGTGLGLAIVHRIVTDHGGFVRAQAVATGTRFTIELPESLLASRRGKLILVPSPGLSPHDDTGANLPRGVG